MRKKIIGNCTLYNCDCRDLMKQYPDKHFDIAIVDPPWGVNAGCSGIKKSKKTMKIYTDIPPDTKYFNDLFRISKKQIIFGANMFSEVPRRIGGWVFWDKNNHYKIFSDGELIWVSCENKIKKYTFDMGYNRGFDYNSRIHPNQKPVEIYKWLLSNYAKQGNKILDTHFGSGSIAVACNELGFELTASEIDADYFEAACKRIKEAYKQPMLAEETNG